MIVRQFNLTPEECGEAIEVGRMRHESHGGSPGSVKGGDDPLDIHIKGAIAEYAFVLGYGVSWTGRFFPIEEWLSGGRTVKDAARVDIKSTKYADGRLLLKKEDTSDPTDPVVLARMPTANGRVIRFPGWATAAEVKRFWNTAMPTPCWVLPNNRLRPMEELESRLGLAWVEMASDW